MVGAFGYYTICCGLVLGSSMLSHFLGVSLPMPAPEVLGGMIKEQLMEYLEILITNLVPALGFSLVIRKLTS